MIYKIIFNPHKPFPIPYVSFHVKRAALKIKFEINYLNQTFEIQYLVNF